MRRIPVILSLLSLVFTSACLNEDILGLTGEDSQIAINIALPNLELGESSPGQLGKTVAIKTITLTVTADDMDDVKKDLTISADGTTASGSVKVPRGDDRTFLIECKDGGGIVQYSGSTVQDIHELKETVSIVTVGHYPTAPLLSVTNTTYRSVRLAWTKSNEADFYAYEIVRAANATDIADASKRQSVKTITNRSDNFFVDLTVQQNKVYYYAVVTWDTEGLGMRSTPKGVRTARLAEILDDDGDPVSGFYWSTSGQGSASILAAAQRVRIITARYYITDISEGGTFTSGIIGDDGTGSIALLGSKEITATSTGWVDVLYGSDNIEVNGDFYVMIMYDGINKPSFGYDLEDNARAWDWDGESWTQYAATYFMRAIVELPGNLLKEIGPGGESPPMKGQWSPEELAEAVRSFRIPTGEGGAKQERP